MNLHLSALKTYSLLCLCLSFLFFSTGCKKYDEVKIGNTDPEYAIPLVQTNFSIEDILNNFDDDTFVTIGADGLITLNYKGEVTARSSTDIFESVAQTQGQFPLLDTSSVLPFATPNGFDMDFAIINNGTLRFIYFNTILEPMNMTIKLPNLITPGGEAFEYKQYHPTGHPSLPFLSEVFDLKNHILKPTNDSIYVQYEAIIESSGERKKIDVALLELLDFTASYIEGYMGNEIYSIPRDTIEIDFFENWTRGDVRFEEPKISAFVINSFGFPVRSKANIMNIISADGSVVPLQSNYLDSINVAYPTIAEAGEEKTTYFSFDKDNSNIIEVLGSSPVAVDYEMEALANPDRDTTIRGFMTDSSRFRIQIEVELPMYGKASGFAANEILDINLSQYENVASAELKIVSENTLPLNVGLQGYFLDGNQNIIDSLFQEVKPVIASAPIDVVTGEVTGMEELVSFIPIDRERFKRLQNSKQLLLSTFFSSYDDGQVPVKILNTQGVDIRMGLKIELER